MQFTTKTLSTLEYDKMIEMLAEHASTDGARARALSLMPSDDYRTVLERQTRTDDAKRLVNAKGYPSFSAPQSTVSSAERAYKGAILSPRELLDVASLLHSTRMMLDYIDTDKLFDTSLDEIFRRMLPNRALEDRIYIHGGVELDTPSRAEELSVCVSGPHYPSHRTGLLQRAQPSETQRVYQ